MLLPYTKFFEKATRGLQLVSLIFCMIFEEKRFSRYTLLTDQMPLPDFLYLLI